jgi:hypothetical protein
MNHGLIKLEPSVYELYPVISRAVGFYQRRRAAEGGKMDAPRFFTDAQCCKLNGTVIDKFVIVKHEQVGTCFYNDSA